MTPIANSPQLEESFRASQHSALHNLVFSNPEECTRLLRIFHKKMSDKTALNRTMQKSDQGANGFTFLCSVSSFDCPLSDIKNKDIPFSAHPIDFVLKWEEKELGLNERMCARFLGSYGFSTPKIVACDEETNKSLTSLAIERRSAEQRAKRWRSVQSLLSMPCQNSRPRILNMQERIKNFINFLSKIS